MCHNVVFDESSPLQAVKGSSPSSPDQFVYSPASLLILLMAMMGSKAPAGQTRTQMAKGLYIFAGRDVGNELGQSETDSVALYDNYLAQFTSGFPSEGTCVVLDAKDNATLCIANSLFYEKEYKLKDTFVEKLSRDYKFQVDSFSQREPQAAATKMNNWVSENTRGKIDKLVDAFTLETTKLVLINAIYFKGSWRRPFDPLPEMTFSRDEEKTFTVNAASISGKIFEYLEDEKRNFRALTLRFKTDGFKFILFLPKTRFGVMDLPYSELGYIEIAKDERWKSESVNVRVPEFKIDSEHDLKKLMIRAGVIDLFNHNASLPGLSEQNNLYVSEVKQKATIEFNRFGLEAAAATMVRVNVKSMRFPLPAIDFFCDEPFSYALVDSEREKLLFIGRYNQPKQK